MKILYRQSLALMLLITMIHAVSRTNFRLEPMLRNILDEAKNASSQPLEGVSVPWKSAPDGTTCGKHFFCLAEKALRTTTHFSTSSKLTRLLALYNKGTKNVNCHLNTTQTNLLHKLLKDIQTCAVKTN